jgi:hypothetical protein
MCATCGCGMKNKSMPGYGKGPKAKRAAKKAAPAAAKKASMNKKKGM